MSLSSDTLIEYALGTLEPAIWTVAEALGEPREVMRAILKKELLK